MTAAEILVSLQERFCGPQYAFLPAVRDRTGMGASRTADAMAMSLWPSRGLELFGFEIKVSRMDWLRELKAPEKSEELFGYCDRWYVVVADKSIVHNGELPPTWGLMLPRGKQIIIEVEAPKLEPSQLDRLFVAALLRRASAVCPNTLAVMAAVKRTEDECMKHFEEQRKIERKHDAEDLNQLRNAVKEFEEKSGVHISMWGGGHIGEAVRLVTEGRLRDLRREFGNIRSIAERVVRDADIALSHKLDGDGHEADGS